MNSYDVYDLLKDRLIIHDGKANEIVEALPGVTRNMFYNAVSRDVPIRKHYRITVTGRSCVRLAEERKWRELMCDWDALRRPFVKSPCTQCTGKQDK